MSVRIIASEPSHSDRLSRSKRGARLFDYAGTMQLRMGSAKCLINTVALVRWTEASKQFSR